MSNPALDRLNARTRLEDRGYTTPCRIWLGPTSGSREHPYPSMWFEGRTQLAHRVAYSLVVGPIPVGAELDHLCHVPLCVRASHLEPVTSKVNVHRSNNAAAVNARLTTCRRGHPFTGTWRGRRTCRACSVERSRRYRERKAA